MLDFAVRMGCSIFMFLWPFMSICVLFANMKIRKNEFGLTPPRSGSAADPKIPASHLHLRLRERGQPRCPVVARAPRGSAGSKRPRRSAMLPLMLRAAHHLSEQCPPYSRAQARAIHHSRQARADRCSLLPETTQAAHAVERTVPVPLEHIHWARLAIFAQQAAGICRPPCSPVQAGAIHYSRQARADRWSLLPETTPEFLFTSFIFSTY